MTLPPLFGSTLTRRARSFLHWRADRFDVNALTGQTGTFSRAGTASALDFAGTSATIVHSAPAWQMEDWDGDSSRESVALLMGGSNRLWWPMIGSLGSDNFTVYVEFVERGAVGVNSAHVLFVGKNDVTGAYFQIASNTSAYYAGFYNGTSTVTSLLGAAPSTGNRVALRATFETDGKIQLFQSINGAAETSATKSSALTFSGFGDNRLYLGSAGDFEPGTNAFLRLRVSLGLRSAAEMQATW